MEEYHLKNLIKKYVEGSATEEERKELSDWYHSTVKEELPLPYENEEEETEARQQMLDVLLTRINQHKGRRGRIVNLLRTAAVAAVLAGLFVVAQVGGFWSLIGGSKEQYDTIVTRTGEHKFITLVDGSKIWLGAESELRYPRTFKAVNREVCLIGEAFFDVAKDKTHPFIIHTENSSTRVLGTSFNISAFKNHSDLKVSLVTGKVAFDYKGSQYALTPGNEITLNKRTSNVKITPIANIDAIINRRNGYYEYQNIPVAEIIEDINLNFNIKVVTQGDVGNCTFFGRLKPGESVDKFLTKLCKVVNAELIKVNKGYLIKGRGCN